MTSGTPPTGDAIVGTPAAWEFEDDPRQALSFGEEHVQIDFVEEGGDIGDESPKLDVGGNAQAPGLRHDSVQVRTDAADDELQVLVRLDERHNGVDEQIDAFAGADVSQNPILIRSGRRG